MTITEPTTPDGLAAFRSALHGQYAIQRELGRGGMGIVLLARDEKLDRSVNTRKGDYRFTRRSCVCITSNR